MSSDILSISTEELSFDIEVLTNSVQMDIETPVLTEFTMEMQGLQLEEGVRDVQINGTTIVSSNIANLLVNGTYSSTNYLATINSINTDNLTVGSTEFIIDGGGPM